MPNTPLTWRDEQTANTTTAGIQLLPDVIQLANGNLVVCWVTNDQAGLGAPAGFEVFAQIFDPLGSKIGAEIRLNNASTTGNEVDPQLAALPTGGFVVVYHDQDLPANGAASNIRLEEYDAVGGAASANPLVVNDAGLPADPNYGRPTVAVSSATSVLIVYEEVTAGVAQIRGKIYNPVTDTYSAQINLFNLPAGLTDPQVAVLANGNYVVVFRSAGADADPAILYRMISPEGVLASSAFTVGGTNSNGFNDAQPSIVALTGGGFAIAWTSTNGADTDIRMVFYNAAGTPIGSAVVADTPGEPNNNNEPALVALADGTLAVIYDNDKFDRLDVTRFTATGGSLGTFNFAGAANAPAGVGLADGRFAAVWSNSNNEISLEILDTRDAPNSEGVYAPDQWVVGTVGNDVFTPPANVEIVHGWTGNDVIAGGSGNNILYGDAGNDQLFGNEGNDFLVGGSGSDIMVGGIGDDTYYVDDSSDAITELAGEGNDRIAASISLSLAADANIERIEAVNLTATNAMDLTGSGIANVIYGNDGVNILRGEAGNDELRGFGGNDFLVGGTGTDLMVGGAGDDTFYVDDASDAIGEIVGEGNDRIAASVSLVLSNGAHVELLEAVNLLATTAFDLTGSDSNNTITGNNGVNILRGEGGNDILSSAGGDDFLVGGSGVDAMTGGAGNDTYYVDDIADAVNEIAGEGTSDRVAASVHYALATNADVERLEADPQSGSNALNLFGSSIANLITGNDGQNFLDGRGGGDVLTGLGGADTFAFSTALGAGNVDTVNGFVSGSDRIALDDAVFGALAPGALSASAFVIGATATSAAHRIIYDSATGALLYDADGNGAGAAVQFATLGGNPVLVASEFQVI